MELAGLVTIMLSGHWQEMRALGRAQDALAAVLPDEAECIGPDGDVASVETVPATTRSPTSLATGLDSPVIIDAVRARR